MPLRLFSLPRCHYDTIDATIAAYAAMIAAACRHIFMPCLIISRCRRYDTLFIRAMPP